MNSEHTDRGVSFRSDRRAVSTAVGYVLSLAIMALLISGLLIAGGNFLDSERDRVARDQLTVVGERVGSGVENIDRLAGTSAESPTAFVRIDLPARIAGSNYRITVTNTTDDVAADRPYAYDLTLEVTETGVEQRIPVRTHHPVANGTINGGDLAVVYHDTGGGHELELRREISVADLGTS